MVAAPLGFKYFPIHNDTIYDWEKEAKGLISYLLPFLALALVFGRVGFESKLTRALLVLFVSQP